MRMVGSPWWSRLYLPSCSRLHRSPSSWVRSGPRIAGQRRARVRRQECRPVPLHARDDADRVVDVVARARCAVLAESRERRASRSRAAHGVDRDVPRVTDRQRVPVERGAQILGGVESEVSAHPGVVGVSTVGRHAAQGFAWRSTVAVEGSRSHARTSTANEVGPGFFAMLDIPVLLGRDFDRGRHPRRRGSR